MQYRALAGATAGLAGGAAFAAEMLVDMAASRQPANDFLLLGGMLPKPDRWRVTGPLAHGLNSAGLGVVYALVEPRLRGPGYLRGLTFALAEHAIAWPLMLVLDRVHPAIRSGDLPVFNRPWPFVAETLRHAAYGVALGAVFERMMRRS